MKTKRITVLLTEDHTIVRQGFRKLLELEDDLEVVGEAQDGRQAIALVKKLHPAVVVMDTLLIFNQDALQDPLVGRTTEQAVGERLERLK
jgi:DNA-binding NarL/FixJ family response regulator